MPRLIELSLYPPDSFDLISAAFAWVILARYRLKRQSYHLLWWGIGIVTYGRRNIDRVAGYVVRLAIGVVQGLVHCRGAAGRRPARRRHDLSFVRSRAGRIAVALLLAVVGVTSIFVILSPVRIDLVDPTMLSGKALAWQSIRRVSPFINSLAALFLVGGAIYSAIRFFGHPESRHVSIGNIFIAVGALLPGVGGMGSRMGHTELLHIAEFIGVILIWIGYKYCQRPLDPANLSADHH